MRLSNFLSLAPENQATSCRAIQNGLPAVLGLCRAEEAMPSLGDAVARIPRESGLDPTVWFRVIVEGRQRLLRAPVRDELYRLVREAVVNAYRHSRAEEIDIEIEYQSTGLSVTIRDNGCGIDPEALRWGSRASSGLRWMRERSEQMGARLRIFSGVARGTEVELYVPGQVVFERS